jgi:hypothetical protein
MKRAVLVYFKTLPEYSVPLGKTDENQEDHVKIVGLQTENESWDPSNTNQES